jgi:pilus assembly protein Flp/PilA
MKTLMKKFFTDESGASLVEYGLLVGLIAVVCIVVIAVLGQKIDDTFQMIVDCLNDPASCQAGS